MTASTNLREITATNAKSLLLSLPPELRVRIFEYVFGHKRHHVRLTRIPQNWRVFLSRCVVDRPGTTHAYRLFTKEEHDASLLTSSYGTSTHSDEGDGHRHAICHYGYPEGLKREETERESDRRLLPTSLLATCKQIHQDAASISWLNHTFEVEFFSDEPQGFIHRMSSAQRKAVRTIAFDYEVSNQDDTIGTRRINDSEYLLISQETMRASYVALTELRRVELFVDMWPDVVAATAKATGTGFDKSLQKMEFDMNVRSIRSLERQDLEDVDVRVEEGARMEPPHTWPFKVSAQQRSEWEEQLQMLIKGRVLELGGEDVMASG